MAVIRADIFQQGKSNKVIAYELNMCESTVKVHVRNPHEENEGEESD